MSLSLFLFHRWIHLCHNVDESLFWNAAVSLFLLLCNTFPLPSQHRHHENWQPPTCHFSSFFLLTSVGDHHCLFFSPHLLYFEIIPDSSFSDSLWLNLLISRDLYDESNKGRQINKRAGLFKKTAFKNNFTLPLKGLNVCLFLSKSWGTLMWKLPYQHQIIWPFWGHRWWRGSAWNLWLATGYSQTTVTWRTENWLWLEDLEDKKGRYGQSILRWVGRMWAWSKINTFN